MVRGLRRVDPDVAWAIVTLFRRTLLPAPARARTDPDAGLVTVAGHRSLIVVNRRVFKHLPGVNMIPLHGSRAFLALDPGRGLSDLELAVADRLSSSALEPRERAALKAFRVRLRTWHRDRSLQFRIRSIIVVEQMNGRSGR